MPRGSHRTVGKLLALFFWEDPAVSDQMAACVPTVSWRPGHPAPPLPTCVRAAGTPGLYCPGVPCFLPAVGLHLAENTQGSLNLKGPRCKLSPRNAARRDSAHPLLSLAASWVEAAGGAGQRPPRTSWRWVLRRTHRRGREGASALPCPHPSILSPFLEGLGVGAEWEKSVF